MKTCYLSGKMRGLPNYNFPEFHRVTAILRSQGWRVISPAEIDNSECEPWVTDDKNIVCTSYQLTPNDCRRLVARDVNYLLQLRRENNDAIIMMPGYTESIGATAEKAIAIWLDLPVFLFESTNTLKTIRA